MRNTLILTEQIKENQKAARRLSPPFIEANGTADTPGYPDRTAAVCLHSAYPFVFWGSMPIR